MSADSPFGLQEDLTMIQAISTTLLRRPQAILMLLLPSATLTTLFSSSRTEATYLRELQSSKVPAAVSMEENSSSRLLHCQDLVNNVTVDQIISNGRKKIVYQVRFGGENRTAVVKRCISRFCLRSGSMDHEMKYLKTLQDSFGRENTIAVYGECHAPIDEGALGGAIHGPHPHLQKIAAEFAKGGPASLTEHGQPLLTTFGNGHKTTTDRYRECLAQHFTEADLEDLRTIARQYAGFPGNPILFSDPKKTYNSHVFAEQYVLVQAGIRHTDLDDIFPCSDCSYEEALELNCQTVRKLSFRRDLNCSLAYSLENPPRNKNVHIDIPRSNEECALF